ncbi:MAG: hypothetical protein J0L70_04435 [Leptolyngbya sp. UWPOB_LEPTO1]|uniref:hypothetical protein n=1 Tax=Leptolyngbya sp. UWPOB_LEPTO1 TaxID=2815653 RepID=UPI001ACA39B0|nr:hypothetical protein [Leptolyngbya sp. UWPOB_LEPTO1]MBN8559751.1 hypothetical protein [Leptolyngbya sp. UWPOB_LEPTO1]
MDTIQIQINALNSKVDSLHQVIENLGSNVTQALTEIRADNNQGISRSSFGTSNSRFSYSYARSGNASLEHKDVLSDDHTVESTSQTGEKSLSPEIQIQRLTAQLTAAYNRIAALEEQLLAQRIH